MAMPEFPAYALMLADGYTEEANYGLQRTEMDGGLPKQRRLFSQPIITRTITIKVRSDVERARFDNWFRIDIAGGVGWFNWKDPISGQQKRGRISGTLPCRWQWDGRQKWQMQLQIETIG
ncbi:hypothetical protein [Chromobacterium subtsugae]|uniref:hypothetical protein n=1 Tax=Chromobacterium subtsugae TaxID=251747 RepID=UPI0006998155|nr:hypothetical protein [Chromobacterium subtsugae]